jgi:hypothetical protein
VFLTLVAPVRSWLLACVNLLGAAGYLTQLLGEYNRFTLMALLSALQLLQLLMSVS